MASRTGVRERRPGGARRRWPPAPGTAVLPLAVVVLTALFAAQRWGTSRVGRVFGPVMLLWFGALGTAAGRGACWGLSCLNGMRLLSRLVISRARPGAFERGDLARGAPLAHKLPAL